MPIFKPNYRVTSFLCLICLTMAIAGCDRATTPSDSPQRGEAQPVIIAEVAWQPQRTQVEAVGTSRARQSVTLFAETTGEVEAVLFEAGDRVQAGQTLLRLEARDEQLAVQAAQTELEDAERMLERYRRTREAGAVTESIFEEAQSTVQRARIALDRAKEALQDRRVKAPFTGYVGMTDVDPGAQIDPSTPITTLDDRDVLLITFALPEVFYGQVERGDRITAATWNPGAASRAGEITDIDTRIDPQTRAFTVRAALANHEDALRPGMSFRVQMELSRGRYPVIPEIALQWGGDGAYVWAVRDGHAQRVPVSVVMRQQGSILVDAELPEGTEVVVEGLQNLREGLTVKRVADAPGAERI